jgi:hypothetical protein
MKNKMSFYKIVLSVMILIVSVGDISFSQGTAITYDVAVKLALQNNYQVKK